MDPAARAETYRLFARAFEYPDAAAIARVRDGGCADALAQALGAGRADAAAIAALREAGESDALAAEYTRLFDVGAGSRPCSLYGGSYGSTRMPVMAETLRYYEHFGLALAAGRRDMPDHLCTQLEFLHFLAYRQAEAHARGDDAGPYRRAERDFIDRHPGKWVPQLACRLAEAQAAPYFTELACQLGAFLQAVRAALEAPGIGADAAAPARSS